MASSSPTIVSVDFPNEVPPNNTFQVNVDVRQQDGGGPLGAFTSGGCVSQSLSVNAWVTPVTLWVDGEKVDQTTKCCAPGGNTKTASFSVSLSEGTHDVAVKVHPVGDVHSFGTSWKDHLDVVDDDVQATISTSEEASDPSRQSGSSAIIQSIKDAADQLGVSMNMLLIGSVAALGVFLLL